MPDDRTEIIANTAVITNCGFGIIFVSVAIIVCLMSFSSNMVFAKRATCSLNNEIIVYHNCCQVVGCINECYDGPEYPTCASVFYSKDITTCYNTCEYNEDKLDKIGSQTCQVLCGTCATVYQTISITHFNKVSLINHQVDCLVTNTSVCIENAHIECGEECKCLVLDGVYKIVKHFYGNNISLAFVIFACIGAFMGAIMWVFGIFALCNELSRMDSTT